MISPLYISGNGSSFFLDYDATYGFKVATATTTTLTGAGSSDLVNVTLTGTGGGSYVVPSGGQTVRALAVNLPGNNSVYTISGADGTASLTIASGGSVGTNAGSTIANVISCPITLSSTLTTTVNNASGTVDYQGAVGGAFGMTMAGTGTVKLSATNGFTGATTVSAGTLKLNGTGAVSSSSGVSVTSGAVLDLNGLNCATPIPLTLNGTGIASGGALINSSATGATWAGLITLGSAGIEAIDLQYRVIWKRDENGNLYRYKGKVDDDAHTNVKSCYDVILVTDK